MIRDDRPDLTAGLKFVASPRHTGYVDSGAYLKYVTRLAREMGWPVEGTALRYEEAV
jgi:hypothetical protein